MNEFALARIIHVLAVVHWIGGVAMVTTVVIPIVRRSRSDADSVELFETIENRLAWQAKIIILIAGGSGFYMLDFINAWNRYSEPRFWWIHAMTIVWALFMFVLFVAEPLFLHRLFKKHAQINPAKTFLYGQILHMMMLTLSLVTIAGAVAGSHGWFPI